MRTHVALALGLGVLGTGLGCGDNGNGPRNAGESCRSERDCLSGVCTGGNCCTAACSPDPTCGRNEYCDGQGACIYPANAGPCTACSGNLLSTGNCNSVGACEGIFVPCPGNLQCKDDRVVCLTQCAASTDCVGSCTAGMLAPGTCLSGTCGPGTPGPCPGNLPCKNQFICLTQCAASTDCVTGFICDTATNGCVAPSATTGGTGGSTTGGGATTGGTTGGSTGGSTTGGCSPASGGTINVDGMTGNDATPCCGIGANRACQTLTWAMRRIDAAQARDVTIHATVNGGGGDWTSKETYPVTLGWGVELSAPGVFFLDPAPKRTIHETFDVKYYAQGDGVGYASIVGSAASPVSVGMNSANSRQTGDLYAIVVETGSTLYIANASVNGSNLNATIAFRVAPKAKLLLGQDRSGGVTGTVTIGNALGQDATEGYLGIWCDGDQVDGPCTIQDADLGGQSSVVIQGQRYEDIDAEFGTISLTSHPVIGVPPSAVGFNNCPHKKDAVDSFAVSVGGDMNFTFKNGVVQCIAGVAFVAGAGSGAGVPRLTIDNTIIQNTDLGIVVTSGTVTVTNTTIQYNLIGIELVQDSSGKLGSVDLSGGGNTVICSSNTEASQPFGIPGMDVYNGSPWNLNASNVAWDTLGPDYFDCDGRYSCTCNLGSCTTTPGLDGMDAVEDSTLKGGITTTNASRSPNHCN